MRERQHTMAQAPSPDKSDDDHEAQRSGFYEAFKELAGEDDEIDAWELQDLLNTVMKKDTKCNKKGSKKGSKDSELCEFSLDSCRSMVALSDADRSGKLGFEEFMELWMSIMAWKSIFKKYDNDNSGNFWSRELHSALCAVGYKVDRKTFKGMVLRYADKDSNISFDSFVACAVKLRHMNETFHKHRGPDSEATFGLDEYLRTAIYS